MLYLSNAFQQSFALGMVFPQAIKITRKPARAFDGKQFYKLETGFGYLRSQFIRAVKEGGREEDGITRRITMLAFVEVSLEDGNEIGVVEEAALQGIE